MFLSPGSAAWHSSCGQAWIWNIKPVKGFTSVTLYRWWYKFHLKFGSHPIRAQLTLWGYRWHGFWVYCRGCCEQTDDDDVWEESGLSYDPSLDKPQGHLAELVYNSKKMRDGCLLFFLQIRMDLWFLHIFKQRIHSCWILKGILKDKKLQSTPWKGWRFPAEALMKSVHPCDQRIWHSWMAIWGN